MKLFSPTTAGSPQRNRSAFTLVEMLVAVGIYCGIMIGVVVALQIFALRIYTLAATKLVATQGAEFALNQIRDDIRQAKLLQVGRTDNSGNFTAVSGTNGAVGNALQVFQTTNLTAPYSLYWLQTNALGTMSSNVLYYRSVSAASITNMVSLSCYITNTDIFSAENWDAIYGTGSSSSPVVPVTISNSVYNNQIYSVKLQFYQWEYPIAYVGGASYNSYDYYQIHTRVCRRALN
jgi:type II secretory pathway pseudopilin PulG